MDPENGSLHEQPAIACGLAGKIVGGVVTFEQRWSLPWQVQITD